MTTSPSKMSQKRLGIFHYGEGLFSVIEKALRVKEIAYSVLDLKTELSWQEIEAWIEKGQFDHLLTANYTSFIFSPHGRRLEDFLAEKKIPLTLWHWEKVLFSGGPNCARQLIARPCPKNFYFLVTDKSDLSTLSQLQNAAAYLPLAADHELAHFRLTPEAEKRFQAPVSFVGSPMKMKELSGTSLPQLRQGYATYALIEFYTRLDKVLGLPPRSKESHHLFLTTLNEFFAKTYRTHSEIEAALNQLQQAWLPHLEDTAYEYLSLLRGRHAFMYSFYQLVTYLDKFVPKGLKLYGSEHWNRMLPSYPHETSHLSDEEFYSVLASSKITFCLTKLQFDQFIHERSLMTLAVGGCPLTDHRAIFDETFEKDEILTYRSAEEALDLIDYYSTHDSERREITLKGQKKVLENHLYTHRIDQMMSLIQDHFDL